MLNSIRVESSDIKTINIPKKKVIKEKKTLKFYCFFFIFWNSVVYFVDGFYCPFTYILYYFKMIEIAKKVFYIY